VVLVGGTVMLFLLCWQLALLLIAAGGVLAVGLRPLFAGLRRAGRGSDGAAGRAMAYLTEMLGGIRTIKAFGAEEYHCERFHDRLQDLKAAQKRSTRFDALVEPLLITSALAILIAILIVGSNLLASGELNTETLVAFLLYALFIIPQARTLSLLTMRFQHMANGLERLNEVAELAPEADAEAAHAFPERPRGDIEICGLSFSYGEGEDVLKEISLRIGAGEHLAVVGESGAGKSTLLSLLLRLHDVPAHQIFIDGRDIRDVTLSSLRSVMATVPQETILFDDTVMENIRYGRPEATDAEVRAACESAQAAAFVEKLPAGYETALGERGLRLSGGERQRLAIARALLRDAPILLLDEATSALDSHTERLLQAGMASLMAGRTTVVIAHRLATVKNLPRIVVLAEGRIVAEGSHDALLRDWEPYRRLVATQLIAGDAVDRPVTTIGSGGQSQ